MQHVARFGLVLLLLGIRPGLCFAQETISLGIVAGMTSQSTGDSDRYLHPAVGGSTWGGLVFVDRVVGERFSVGGEVSGGGNVSGVQKGPISFLTDAIFHTTHRDLIASSVLKVQASPRTYRAQLALVGGLGVAWRSTQRIVSTSSPFRGQATPSREESFSDSVVAATVGFDAGVTISPRTALVIVGRVHMLADDDRTPDGLVSLGVGSIVWRLGGGGRIWF